MKAPLPLLLTAHLFLKGDAAAQTAEPFIENARNLALATASTALAGEAGMASNPAGLAFFEKKLAAQATAATPFFLKNWKRLSFAAAAPLGPNGHLAAAVARSGIPDFFWNTARIGYGRLIGKGLGAGVTASFSTINAKEYGRTTGLTAGLGLLWQPRPQLWAGFSIQNPTATGWKTGEERSPVLRTGLAYRLNPLVLSVVEMEKSLGTPVGLKGGLEYGFLKKAVLRSGIRSGPFRWAFGGAVELSDGFRLDFAADWRPALGVTPAAGVVWLGEKKKK